MRKLEKTVMAAALGMMVAGGTLIGAAQTAEASALTSADFVETKAVIEGVGEIVFTSADHHGEHHEKYEKEHRPPEPPKDHEHHPKHEHPEHHHDRDKD
ncbi:MAG: hypothetical protein II591_01095 [Schwartzia sp.]|nr:hypothetical protein [Schwartzia sp. (in: firmicutes)]